MARKKKKKLFVVFVDFSQAYDLVPRLMLFRCLETIRLWSSNVGSIDCHLQGNEQHHWNCYFDHYNWSLSGKFHIMSSIYFVLAEVLGAAWA